MWRYPLSPTKGKGQLILLVIVPVVLVPVLTNLKMLQLLTTTTKTTLFSLQIKVITKHSSTKSYVINHQLTSSNTLLRNIHIPSSPHSQLNAKNTHYILHHLMDAILTLLNYFLRNFQKLVWRLILRGEHHFI